MFENKRQFGLLAEQTAVNFLKKRGYKIVLRNYRTRLGEIDIIAYEKDTLCFIEVKSRKTQNFGNPKEKVDLKKQTQIIRCAVKYLQDQHLLDRKIRFDVVSISYNLKIPTFELIEHAFELNERCRY